MKKADLLVSFIKLNKSAREKKANREGYASAAAYIHFLSTNEAPKVEVNVKVKVGKKEKSKPTIHVVDILDKSGSMSGNKIKAANKGINSGLKDLRGVKKVKYTYTLCAFSNHHTIKFPYVMEDPEKVPNISIDVDGYTALFDAIGQTFKRLSEHVKTGDKVLMNIYTDGGENDSRNFRADEISEMIRDRSKKGWTVTFVGTQVDVNFVNSKLSVDMSNSLVYDGSSEGLEASFVATRSARTSYTSDVLAGNDVSVGFYKNIK